MHKQLFEKRGIPKEKTNQIAGLHTQLRTMGDHPRMFQDYPLRNLLTDRQSDNLHHNIIRPFGRIKNINTTRMHQTYDF